MVAMYPGSFTGTKYRLGIWAERLRRRGFEVELSLAMADRHSERLANDWSVRARAEFHIRMLRGRLATVRRAGRFHTAVIHINDLPFWDKGPPFVAAAIHRLAGRVILDLDDLPLVARQTELNQKSRALGQLVDGLSLGNRALREHYPGRPWWLVPTCLEPAEWQVPDRAARDGPPLLGWVGTPGNLRNLEPLAPALADICRRHGTKLRIVCSQPAALPDVPEEFVQWTPAGEQADLMPIDVGLAPLLDVPKQRYTCGLKALQYMATGAPVVGSPVGPLERDREEWRDGISGLDAGGMDPGARPAAHRPRPAPATGRRGEAGRGGALVFRGARDVVRGRPARRSAARSRPAGPAGLGPTRHRELKWRSIGRERPVVRCGESEF